MPARDMYDKYFPSWRKPHNFTVDMREVVADPEEIAQAEGLEKSLLEKPQNRRMVLDHIHIVKKPSSQAAEKETSQPSSVNMVRTLPRREVQKIFALAARAYDSDKTNVEIGVPVEPFTFAEAMSLPDADKWLEAINSELNSLYANETFTEVSEVPAGQKEMGGRWVFKHKVGLDGEVKYKARLVIKGYEQRFGVHYTETYAPVINLRTVRVLLALAAYLNLEIHQMDVETAFLHSGLPVQERTYMKLPVGYDPKSPTTKALLLLKSLYGLKQAPLLWNRDIHGALTDPSFPCKLRRSISDECLYIGVDVIIGIYVDDLLIFARDIKVVNTIKTALMARYKMKDLGEAKKFLGLRITRDRVNHTLRIDQEEYCLGIVRRFGLQNHKSRFTPMQPNLHLTTTADSTVLLTQDALLY